MDTPKNISTLYRKMHMGVNSRLSPLELSSAKAMFLFCLYDNGTMSQVNICRELDMDKSTVAKMLMRLEKDGFVTKSVNPDDIRSYQVTLTDKAISLIPRAKEIHQLWLEEITSSLTELEKRNFFELLERVADTVNKRT